MENYTITTDTTADLPEEYIEKHNLGILSLTCTLEGVTYSKENPLDVGFSDEIAKEIFCASTGMYTAAQLAAYMGFSEINLIGVDHHFRTSVNNKGEIVIDDKVKDYFTDKYNEDKDKLYIPNTEKSTLTYVAMKRHCDQRGIRVYNATRGGKLEVFPRVEFDSLF